MRTQRELDDTRTTLDELSVDTLLKEFLDDQTTAGKYESELGVLSQVRNDFERLSRMIARATADHADGRGPEPTVSRIVLYIDDLDLMPREAGGRGDPRGLISSLRSRCSSVSSPPTPDG